MKFFQKTKKGFTLVETLVAISILSLAVVGPLSIVSRSLSISYYARDQVTAFYLAQDAIEYIRNVRDTNFLNSSSDWLNNLVACTTGECTVDSRANNVTSCDSTCLPMNKDLSGGFGYDTGGSSNFTRTVEIKVDGENPDEASVKVHIEWTTGNITKSFDVKEIIFNLNANPIT